MISVVVETVNFETETQALKFETKTRDFKICAFCQIKKNVVITSKLNFFFISGIFRSVFVVSYLQIQLTKNC